MVKHFQDLENLVTRYRVKPIERLVFLHDAVDCLRSEDLNIASKRLGISVGRLVQARKLLAALSSYEVSHK